MLQVIASAPYCFLYLNQRIHDKKKKEKKKKKRKKEKKKKPPISFHTPRPLHLQSWKSQLHVVQCTIPTHPPFSSSCQASRPGSLVLTMDDLPPLPSSGAPSRAPSTQSSSPELPGSHLFIRDFVRETRQRLNLSSIQLPILDDRQLAELSDGETILVPLSCSSLNTLASMTRQLDTITTQLGTIQGIVATLPTTAALNSKLSPIHASLRDLSQRVSAPPPPKRQPPLGHQFPRLVRPHARHFPPFALPFPLPVPPHAPRPSQLNLRRRPAPPPQARLALPLSTPTFPGMTRTPKPFTATPRPMRISSLTPGKRTRSAKGSTLIPPPSSRATSPPTVTSPNPRMLTQP